MSGETIVARFVHSRTGEVHPQTFCVPLVATDHAGHLRREAAWKAVRAAWDDLRHAGYAITYRPADADPPSDRKPTSKPKKDDDGGGQKSLF